MYIRNLLTTPLQIFSYICLTFKVILKSITGPDDNGRGNLNAGMGYCDSFIAPNGLTILVVISL